PPTPEVPEPVPPSPAVRGTWSSPSLLRDVVDGARRRAHSGPDERPLARAVARPRSDRGAGAGPHGGSGDRATTRDRHHQQEQTDACPDDVSLHVSPPSLQG